MVTHAIRAGVLVASAAALAAADVVLFDNGPFVTATGVGFGGADVSQTQPGFLTGLSADAAASIRLAESFTVPQGQQWETTTLAWYAFQQQTANFTTTFAFRDAFVALYAADPSTGAAPIAGNFTTDRLTGGAFTGVYRVASSAGQVQSRARPIFRVDLDLAWAPTLAPGEYWIAVSFVGAADRTTAPSSGPTAPIEAGDRSLQFAGGAWIELEIDLPFVLRGDLAGGPTCGSIDFDGDGDEGTDADIEAFFIAIAGGACPTGTCGSIDFDGDGDEGTDADIEAFFRRLSGGPCQL